MLCFWPWRWRKRDRSHRVGVASRSRRGFQKEHGPVSVRILVQWHLCQTLNLNNCRIREQHFWNHYVLGTWLQQPWHPSIKNRRTHTLKIWHLRDFSPECPPRAWTPTLWCSFHSVMLLLIFCCCWKHWIISLGFSLFNYSNWNWFLRLNFIRAFLLLTKN